MYCLLAFSHLRLSYSLAPPCCPQEINAYCLSNKQSLKCENRLFWINIIVQNGRLQESFYRKICACTLLLRHSYGKRIFEVARWIYTTHSAVRLDVGSVGNHMLIPLCRRHGYSPLPWKLVRQSIRPCNSCHESLFYFTSRGHVLNNISDFYNKFFRYCLFDY